jgi:hypothetical protein
MHEVEGRRGVYINQLEKTVDEGRQQGEGEREREEAGNRSFIWQLEADQIEAPHVKLSSSTTLTTLTCGGGRPEHMHRVAVGDERIIPLHPAGGGSVRRNTTS